MTMLLDDGAMCLTFLVPAYPESSCRSRCSPTPFDVPKEDVSGDTPLFLGDERAIASERASVRSKTWRRLNIGRLRAHPLVVTECAAVYELRTAVLENTMRPTTGTGTTGASAQNDDAMHWVSELRLLAF